MSAKKGLSSTLRNLKFMQRAAVAQKVEEKVDVEVEMEAEVSVPVANGGEIGSSVQVARKCVVVMEGNPHPGAVKGRMSFLNFNPAIDKLNDEASGRPTQSASPSNSHQDSANNTTRTDDVSAASRFRDFNIDSSESISLNELKRKEPELEMETPLSRKLPKTAAQNAGGQSSSRSNVIGSRNRNKSNNKREKLDYNLLRQRKS